MEIFMSEAIVRVIVPSAMLILLGCSKASEQPPPREDARAAPSAALRAPEAKQGGADGAPGSGPKIETYGALFQIFHQNKTGPQVTLSSILNPKLQAVGALSESRGEVSIVDGAVWLSYPDGKGGARVENVPQSDERAMLLVAANVEGWRRVPVEEDITADDLDRKLEERAVALGVDVKQAFPVRVEGPVADLHWHVLDASKLEHHPGMSHEDHIRGAVKGTVPQGDALLVGFFSKEHHGVFTHMGSNSHFHVVLAKENISGHVDSVTIKKGATLLLPE
ncbi:hypothetical protein BE08_06035 [Sorangium cellulosum]|uniref:Uncharacterized protein n=1 Tax=Sorangium cellulosum TaxID=56 RepID=A0A150P2V9_SORCE|nr:hypothetical protein BE08_06035 [Sorangium cellulosum]